jgi:hypothetical protein
MYIKHLIKRTTYSILDLISEDCLDKINSKFNTYYQKRKLMDGVGFYGTEQHTFKEYQKIMQEIPKGNPNIK